MLPFGEITDLHLPMGRQGRHHFWWCHDVAGNDNLINTLRPRQMLIKFFLKHVYFPTLQTYILMMSCCQQNAFRNLYHFNAHKVRWLSGAVRCKDIHRPFREPFNVGICMEIGICRIGTFKIIRITYPMSEQASIMSSLYTKSDCCHPFRSNEALLIMTIHW